MQPGPYRLEYVLERLKAVYAPCFPMRVLEAIDNKRAGPIASLLELNGRADLYMYFLPGSRDAEESFSNPSGPMSACSHFASPGSFAEEESSCDSDELAWLVEMHRVLGVDAEMRSVAQE
jgi:hypothetical protein